jgi:hypothetical protein
MRANQFQVIWSKRSEADLARLWFDHVSVRGKIRRSADTIDRNLRDHPLNVGESREGNERICHLHPLAITFEVSTMDRLVKVEELWWIGFPPNPSE